VTEVTSETRVFMRHVRGVPPKGICGPGVRDYFKRNPQLDIRDLNDKRGKGIPASAVLATNDLFAARVVEVAEKEARNG
jgi:hypothetical protein